MTYSQRSNQNNWLSEYKTLMGKARTLSDVTDMSGLVNLAEQVGEELVKAEVSSRQIRVLLSETTAAVSRIERGATIGNQAPTTDPTEKATQRNRDAQREAALLNIALVYAAARSGGSKKDTQLNLDALAVLVKEMSGQVKTFEDFKVLRKFSEAVVAYFKFHGGK